MRFEPSRREAGEERMLPLINVVFLLLIFFMLSGQLATTDPFGTEPPRSTSEGLMHERQIVVHLAADGRLAFNGAIMDETALRDAVARHGPSSKVQFKADGRADAVRMVATMELLRSAGVERVDLLTRLKGR